MKTKQVPLEHFAPDAFRFYRAALDLLSDEGVPFLVGGAYAFGYYTGIARHTKDLDIFVRPRHAQRVLDLFEAADFRTEMVFEHWLGKVFLGDDFIDVIFNSGNGLCHVDDAWFAHAVEGEVLGKPVNLMPVEEMIWQKSFIMERERFDGADVNHLLRARGRRLDWQRLIARFGENWRVLLSHLVLYNFVYPNDREAIPAAVLNDLTDRLRHDRPSGPEDICRGALLSRMQYLPDIEEWGYADPRLEPSGTMTPEEVQRWTDAGR